MEAGDYRFNAVLTEELAKVNMALPSCVGIHADIVAPYLVHLTTDEQKQRWLPRFCTGELLTAIGMTEPSGGSDLAALKTTAVADGDDWVLNGSKTFITNGYSADLVVVAARTSPEKKARGITLFGVETDRDGFSRGRKLDKVGQDESDTAELFFEDVRVPDDDVIGEVDAGFIHMMTWLPQERLGSAITNLAHAAQILDETIEYAKDRKAFGQPIGTFQHNKFLLADLVTQVEVTQAYVDQCVLAHTEGDLTADRRGQGQVVDRPGAERGPRPLRPDPRRLRLHERVPRRPRLARRPRHQDLGRLQRDHEGAHRPRPRAGVVVLRLLDLTSDHASRCGASPTSALPSPWCESGAWNDQSMATTDAGTARPAGRAGHADEPHERGPQQPAQLAARERARRQRRHRLDGRHRRRGRRRRRRRSASIAGIAGLVAGAM